MSNSQICEADAGASGRKHRFGLNCLRWALGIVTMIAVTAPGMVQAQVPPLVEAELVKMGHVVDPGCTGKLYRTLFGKNDYNTYWPVDAAMPNKTVKLYPGVTVTRDVSYGPQPKDVLDVFMPDKAGANRTILLFIPGGAGNKIEQQSVEANMFYDNIGVWAANNGMVGVTIQRSTTAAGQNVALAIEWLQANAAKFKGNADDLFLMAHSAGTASLGAYISRPDLYGQAAKGAIFLGGSPNLGGGGRGGGGGAAGGGGGRGGAGGPAAGGAPAAGAAAPGGAGAPAAAGAGGRGGAAAGAAAGGGRGGGAPNANGAITCNANSQAGAIRGPSSLLPDQGAGAAARRAELAGDSPWRWDGKMWISTGAAAPAPAAAGAAGGGAGGRGGAAAGAAGGAAAGGRGGGGGRGGAAAAPAGDGAAPAAPVFTALDGYRSTRAAIAIGYGQWDLGGPEVEQGPTAAVKAIHDELCKLEGPKPKDGVGHCPTVMWFKGESHMSEVFSFGSIDKTVSDQVTAFIKDHH